MSQFVELCLRVSAVALQNIPGKQSLSTSGGRVEIGRYHNLRCRFLNLSEMLDLHVRLTTGRVEQAGCTSRLVLRTSDRSLLS